MLEQSSDLPQTGQHSDLSVCSILLTTILDSFVGGYNVMQEFGEARVYTDVWSSADFRKWRRDLATAPWQGR